MVLRHEGHAGPAAADHWDLMLEDGGALATWQLWRWPVDGSGAGDAADEIFRHRAAYLEYEGPVSGDRGTVRRVDEGRYVRLSGQKDRWEVRFEGGMLRGRFVLARVSGERWQLQRVE